MEFKKELNSSQYKAITRSKGPLLILAGAGSGKTRALTYRIAYHIKEKGVAPKDFLAVTFTNKAAQEMKKRLVKLVGKRANTIWITTFHSACARILRRDIQRLGYKNTFTIYDQDDSKRLIRNCLKDLDYDTKKFPPAFVAGVISSAKNELIDPEEFAKMTDNFKEEVVADVYYAYRERLLENNALDFDDLLNVTVSIFELFPEILNKYQEQFRFIMIDEYQDTNKAQYRLVNLLAEKYRNITVVGDEDQSIYGWRGADIRNILNFEKDFPESKTIKLEQNYRSSKTILETANDLIANNSERKPKTLWTENVEGSPVTVYQAKDDIDEAEFIISQIKSKKRKLNDVAVFYRVNAQSRSLEEACMRYKIPYQIIGGVKFYEREEVKDILAYLKVINNPNDSVSFERIINKPNRGIGKTTQDNLKRKSRKEKKPLNEILKEEIKEINLSTKAMEQAKKLIKLLDNVQKSDSIVKSIKLVLKQTKYKEFLQRIHPSDFEDRLANIEELLISAAEFEHNNPEKKLNDYLEEVALVSGIDDADFDKAQLSLMTMHNAKGLEFAVVFVAGMEEGVIPHLRSMGDTSKLEEERRLCYVAITRAMDELFLSYALSRHRYGHSSMSMRSRFLTELPDEKLNYYQPEEKKKDIPQFMEGDLVFHQKFGKGKVLECDDGKIMIEFITGKKNFLAEYAPLTKVEK